MIIFLLFLNPIDDFKVAKGLFNDGMYEIAEKELKNFLINYKESEYAKEAAVLYLKSLYAQGKYDVLINDSKKMLLEYPEKKDDILELKGKGEMRMMRYNDAERTFNQIQDRKKRYSLIGDMYYGKGDYKNAIIYYQKIGDDFGNSSIGWCYYKMNRFDDAIKYFNLVKDKKYIEEAEYMSSKLSFLKTGEIERMDNYLKKYPKGRFRANAFITLGDFYEEKDIKKSINFYKKIIEEKLQFSDYALYKIGLNYFKSEIYDSSVYYFNLVEPHSKYFGECLYYTARIKSIKGEDDIAINLYRQVAKDYKELMPRSIFRIAEIHKKRG